MKACAISNPILHAPRCHFLVSADVIATGGVVIVHNIAMEQALSEAQGMPCQKGSR